MATSSIQFTKMHGLGNDYVYVDMRSSQVTDAPALARLISDRHRGVGSDGLILIHPSQTADARMEMYNADGSRAQMCGNGIRCVAKYAVEHGFADGPELVIDTDDGLKKAWIVDREDADRSGGETWVKIDMGMPQLSPSSLPVSIEGERVVDHPLELEANGGQRREFQITCVSMGNPHATVFLEDVRKLELETWGPALESAEAFPERVNAHFVQVLSNDRILVRTWERGSGPTEACGTGACAVVVAASITKRGARRMTTMLPGGDLHIDWADDDHVYMTGPAEEVFTGRWSG